MLRRAFFIAVWCAAPLLNMPVAQAETALRAPLSIIPPPMQVALDQRNVNIAGGGKLAPRVAARQMKRAVRAVAATPGSQGDVVQVGQLGALEDAPVGLESGLAEAVWNGARLAFVTDQMARLPQHLALSGLYQLERQLHRGASAAPVGTADDTSWFGARLMRLLALGDTQSVIDLEAETGAARSDGYVARAMVLAHLGRGDRAAACAQPRPQRGTIGRRDTLSFFMQMLVYCQLLSGEFEKASLTLELNEKTLGKDALYREIAYLMAAQAPLVFGSAEEAAAAKAEGAEPPLVLPDELTPLQIALLQLAGQALPEGLVNVPNYFVRSLAGDYAQSPMMQLRAALKAVRFGASSELFSQAAQLADLSAYEGPLPLVDNVPQAVFLAQALRVIDATPPVAQPRLMAQYLRRASARGMWRDMVMVFDDRLAAMIVPQARMPEQYLGGGSAASSGVSASLETGLDNPDFEALAPPRAAPTDIPPAPLNEADRLVLLLAHWQNAQRNAAENLIHLNPLHETLARLARWQGYDVMQADAPRGDLFSDDAVAPSQADDGQIAFLQDNQVVVDISAPDETASELASALAPEAAPLPVLSVHVQPDWAVFEARLNRADVREAVFLRRQLALYHAAGADLPERLLVDLVLPEADAVAQRFNRLADNKWIGDLVLAQVAHFAAKPAASYDATDMMLLVGSLRRAGLQEAAEALARDMLLAFTVDLVARAPHLFAPHEGQEGVPHSPPVPFQNRLFDGSDGGPVIDTYGG